MSKEYMTVKEVAAYLRARPKTIYSWASEGKIPAYKVNGLLLFDKSEIDEFIRANKIRPINPSNEAKKILGTLYASGHNFPDSGPKTPRLGRKD
ncbi:helix-turn-helix domain-containing protein [Nitrospina sp. 32_T5]|uniref:helix-turn-helix domain-containing protein n=1 Tax=unclassified Nitrospina TaxID=2638683 RepID=UPI003F9A2546